MGSDKQGSPLSATYDDFISPSSEGGILLKKQADTRKIGLLTYYIQY